MKLVIALLAAFSAVSTAHALESHYGKIIYQKGAYRCSYNNSDSQPQDMKWVVFTMERRGSHGDDFTTQYKVDQIVQPGENLTVGSDLDARFIPWHCRFIERENSVPYPPTPSSM